jgi:hypothetical protein
MAPSPETVALARRLVERRGCAEHEARHAAAARLLGLPLREVRLFDEGETAGVTRVDSDKITSRTHGHVKKLMVMIMCGAIDDYLWPPIYPPFEQPPADEHTASDEAGLATLAKILRLDRQGWDALVDRAHELSERPEFQALEHGFATALEAGEILDEERIAEIEEIVHRRQEAAPCST